MSVFEVELTISGDLRLSSEFAAEGYRFSPSPTGFNLVFDVLAGSIEEARSQAAARVQLLVDSITFTKGPSLRYAISRVTERPRAGEQPLGRLIGAVSISATAHIVLGTSQEGIVPALELTKGLERHRRAEVLTRALRWFSRGIGDPDNIDKFVDYWVGLEALANSYEGSDVEAHVCQDCGHVINPRPIGGLSRAYLNSLGMIKEAESISTLSSGRGELFHRALATRALESLAEVQGILKACIQREIDATAAHCDDHQCRDNNHTDDYTDDDANHDHVADAEGDTEESGKDDDEAEDDIDAEGHGNDEKHDEDESEEDADDEGEALQRKLAFALFLSFRQRAIGTVLLNGRSMPVKRTSADSRYDFFVGILQGVYCGGIQYKTHKYQFKPRFLRAYDLLRKIDKPQDDFDRFVAALDRRFVSAAKSELYRTRKGWIDKAISSGDARIVKTGGEEYLVPLFSKNITVGIDTSSFEPNIRLIGTFIIPDEAACGVYFDKHLGLPKTHNHAEWKWNKLNPDRRQAVLSRFDEFVRICCEAGLIIETDVLSKGKAHFRDRLTNLVEGCFSGYENSQGTARAELRAFFFSLINNTPVHCDADFHPLATEDVVRTIVRQLAKVDSHFQSFAPVNVALRSHESLTIQIADLLVGAMKELRKNKQSVEPFKQLPFDMRKIRHFDSSFAKGAYFVAKNLAGQVQPTVIVPDVASSGGPVPR